MSAPLYMASGTAAVQSLPFSVDPYYIFSASLKNLLASVLLQPTGISTVLLHLLENLLFTFYFF